jgi:hypothetical protein
MKVVVRPGASPAAALVPREASGLDGKVAIYLKELPRDFSGTTRSVAPILGIEWPQSGQSAPDVWPVVLERQITLPAEPDQWHWRSADQLTLSEATIQEAIGFLSQLAAWFAAGQVDSIVAAAMPALTDTATANGTPGHEYIATFRETLMLNLPGPDDLLPITHDDIDIRLAANGRLLDCRRTDWGAPIMTRPGSPRPFRYQPKLGKLGGDWRVF